MRKLPTSSLRCDYNNLFMIYFLFSSSVDQNNFLNKDGHELFIAHMNKCFFIKIIFYDACYCFWTNFKGAFNNYVRGILANFDPRSLKWTKKNTIHLWHYRLWSFKSRDEKLEYFILPFLLVQYIHPSLNTQSCIRRPLCSTFRFENLSISPKKRIFFCFRVQKNEKIKITCNFILCNFLVRTLQCF